MPPLKILLCCRKTLLQTLTLSSALLTNATVSAETIAATDSAHPVATYGTSRLIDISRPAVLETALSADLPPDPTAAQQIIQQRLTPDLTARITKAHQDVADAWSMGVTKIPAVVVDQKYVVYGETNVQRALDRIQAYREANP